MVVKNIHYIVPIIGTFLALLLVSTAALAAPTLYQTERAYSTFVQSGANVFNASSLTRTGDITVDSGSSGSNADILQNVEITLGGTWAADTDINHTRVWSSVAGSSTTGYRYALNVNTSTGTWASSYTITDTDKAPEINISLGVVNALGGTDLVSSDDANDNGYNSLNFTFNISNPSASFSLADVLVTVGFAYNATGGGAYANITDSNDTIADTLVGGATLTSLNVSSVSGNWHNAIGIVATIGAGNSVQFHFIAKTKGGGTNFQGFSIPAASYSGINDSRNTISFAVANYTNTTALFTGITRAGELARGPIRQGVELQQNPNDDTWDVRGYFKNIANDFTYVIDSYSIYNIFPNGTPNGTATYTAAGQSISPGSEFYAPAAWHRLPANTKPYYSTAFEWNVSWGTDDVHSESESRLTTTDWQVIALDSNQETLLGDLESNTENMTLTAEPYVQQLGSTSPESGDIVVFSIIPYLSSDGSQYNWTVNTSRPFNVTFNNGTHARELLIDGSIVKVDHANTTGTANGWVKLTITDLSNASYVGAGRTNQNMSVNDKVYLEYQALSPSSAGEVFTFGTNATLTTESGTPTTETGTSKSITSGKKRLTGWKHIMAYDPSNPTLLNVTLHIEVTDPVGGGIAGIKFVDYIPQGATNFTNTTPTAKFYDGTNLGDWVAGQNFTANETGNDTVSGSPVTKWEYTNATGGTWNLTDGQYIEVSYFINITAPDLYTLPLQIFGLDPDTGERFVVSMHDSIQVFTPVPKPPLLPAIIVESETQLARFITLGKPAQWIKQFEVHNPNAQSLTTTLKASVFEDTMDASATYTDLAGDDKSEKAELLSLEGKRYAQWATALQPFETRAYMLKVQTPPIVETEREVSDIQQTSDDMVNIAMHLTLTSLASEDYENVRLYLDIDNSKIMSIIDDSGEALPHVSAGAGTTILTIPTFEAKAIRTLTIRYKESYPVIFVTPEEERYSPDSTVGLTILVINGGEEVHHPYLETEIYSPDQELIYSSVKEGRALSPVEKMELTERFHIPLTAQGGMYTATVRFREDFALISQATGNFLIAGTTEVSTMKTVSYLVLVILSLVVLFFSGKRIKELRKY